MRYQAEPVTSKRSKKSILLKNENYFSRTIFSRSHRCIRFRQIHLCAAAFLPTEIISSDYCRGLVSDDENNQAATADAFEVLHLIAAKRLAAGKLTVIDATNVQPESRKPLLELARKYHCFLVAIVLDLPEKLCGDRNQQRPNRNFGNHVIRRHVQNLKRSL